MKTVGVYCDGFNIYYGLRNHFHRTGRCYYWLDINSFCTKLARRQPYGSASDNAVIVKYFTADPIEPTRRARHQLYFDMVRRLNNVNIIDGRHSTKNRTCKACGASYPTYEEKETDVSVGLHAMCDAIDGKYERLILVSGDSDYYPLLRMIRDRLPQIERVVAVPLGGFSNSRLCGLADWSIKLKQSDYALHRLPWAVQLPDGSSVTCPVEWQKP